MKIHESVSSFYLVFDCVSPHMQHYVNSTFPALSLEVRKPDDSGKPRVAVWSNDSCKVAKEVAWDSSIAIYVLEALNAIPHPAGAEPREDPLVEPVNRFLKERAYYLAQEAIMLLEGLA